MKIFSFSFLFHFLWSIYSITSFELMFVHTPAFTCTYLTSSILVIPWLQRTSLPSSAILSTVNTQVIIVKKIKQMFSFQAVFKSSTLWLIFRNRKVKMPSLIVLIKKIFWAPAGETRATMLFRAFILFMVTSSTKTKQNKKTVEELLWPDCYLAFTDRV